MGFRFKNEYYQFIREQKEKVAKLKEQYPDNKSRWYLLEYRSPSGKFLYICSKCYRESCTPDKICMKGCVDSL